MMKPGLKTTEFYGSAAGPWFVTLASWIQTGTLDWRMLLATAVMNFGYAISRGLTKIAQE